MAARSQFFCVKGSCWALIFSVLPFFILLSAIHFQACSDLFPLCCNLGNCFTWHSFIPFMRLPSCTKSQQYVRKFLHVHMLTQGTSTTALVIGRAWNFIMLKVHSLPASSIFSCTVFHHYSTCVCGVFPSWNAHSCHRQNVSLVPKGRSRTAVKPYGWYCLAVLARINFHGSKLVRNS